MAETRPPSSKNLVTTDWLAARLGEPEVSIVDGSFYLPALKRDLPYDPRRSFEHIAIVALAPVVLMAHQDVVPVAPGTEGRWTVPPFAGELRD